MGDITGNGRAVTGLGGARGFGETALPRGDDATAMVNVSAVFQDGFKLGGQTYSAARLFVSTDGLVSFGKAATGFDLPSAPFFAIFHADVDTRLDGEGAESGAVWLDVDTANDCVTITWDRVGFYRRNASLTDTFQMQLFDRGNGSFDVVYRYQHIGWTAGDLQGGWGGLGGTAAMLGYRVAADGRVTRMDASGDEAAQLALDTALGNTGVRGLWVFNFDARLTITGTGAANRLAGTAGNDTVHAFGGADTILGSAGADRIDGDAGHDFVDYSASTTAMVVDMQRPARNTGLAAGDRFTQIEGVIGSARGDTLAGNTHAQALAGGAGFDWLYGRAGRDTIWGGDGVDRLFGGEDNDSLSGGHDRDHLYGAGGRDRLYGGDGDDILHGGTGADLLEGGAGDDVLTGLIGADTFWHKGPASQEVDRITDYRAGQGDVLQFGLNARRADFSVSFVNDPGLGRPGVAEAHVLYKGRLIWVLVDGADQGAIMVHSSMNSFDLL